MSHYDELEEKIGMVLEWAEEHPDFDPEFVESLNDQLVDRGTLTDKQEDALDNIIESWNIGED